MTSAEHLDAARRFHSLALELLGRGEIAAAGEMLWGATNRIITAIILHHNLTGVRGNRMRRRELMEYLEIQVPSDTPLEQQLDSVAQLHGHFYNGHLLNARFKQLFDESILLIQALLDRPETRSIPVSG